MTAHLDRKDLQNIIGDVVETDDDDVSNAIERHRSTLNDHDRRKSMMDVAKSRELEQLRQTTSRLMDELEMIRRQNAEGMRARIVSDAAFHEQRLECVRLQHELDTSAHHVSELRRRVESLEVEKKHLCDLLESRVNALKRKQRVIKEFVFSSEIRERSILVEAENDTRAHFQAFCVSVNLSPPKPVDREVVLICTLERLERNDLEQDEMKNRQTLQNRLAYLRRGIIVQPVSPQRVIDRSSATRKSPATDRPWYPPGSARIPATSGAIRRSQSPSATKSETPHRRPAHATLSRMQHLLTSLSAWPEYGSE